MTNEERIAGLIEANNAEVERRRSAERNIDRHLVTIDALETALLDANIKLAGEEAAHSVTRGQLQASAAAHMRKAA